MTARALAARPRAVVSWVGAAVAVATVAAGLGLDAAGVRLGLPHPPFVGNWDLRASAWALAAVPCFAGAVRFAPRLLTVRARPATVASMLLVATLVLRLALAAARRGPEGWAHVFGSSWEAGNEYLPALPAFAYGTGFFLDRFAELVPALPVHAAGHPPGLLLTMHLLGIDTPGRLAALCIGVGALSAPLTYALGRRLLDERGARAAGGLMAIAPGALLFGATSADAVYLMLGLLAAVALIEPRTRLAGGLVLGVVSLFAWSLLAVGAWAALIVLLREGVRPAVRLAVAAGAGLLAVHAGFALVTGFDPLGTLDATARVYVLGIADRRPYAFWLFGSPVAFLLVLGAPIAWLAARRASPESLAIGAVLLVSVVAGFTKAETERIWLFFAPFVCLAAAPLVRRPTALAALLAAQALAYELLFDTVW